LVRAEAELEQFLATVDFPGWRWVILTWRTRIDDLPFNNQIKSARFLSFSASAKSDKIRQPPRSEGRQECGQI
jgi:hypothetical protein